MTFYRYPDKIYFSLGEFRPHLRPVKSAKENRYIPPSKAEISERKIVPSQFKLSYPIVKSLPNKEVENRINNTVITKEAILFKNQVLSMEDSEFTDVVSAYEIPLNEKGLLSILFEFYTYTYHAAHGYTYFDSLTFDLETGKVIEFSELFNPMLNYTSLLSEIAEKKASESGAIFISNYKGISKDQKFYLTPDALVLYYQLYEYTPYVYGRFEIKIPYKELQSLIYPLSPIKKLL